MAHRKIVIYNDTKNVYKSGFDVAKDSFLKNYEYANSLNVNFAIVSLW